MMSTLFFIFISCTASQQLRIGTLLRNLPLPGVSRQLETAVGMGTWPSLSS